MNDYKTKSLIIKDLSNGFCEKSYLTIRNSMNIALVFLLNIGRMRIDSSTQLFFIMQR